MQCPRCQHENSSRAQFCAECVTPTRGPPRRIHGEDVDTENGSYKIKGDPSHV